MWELGAVDTGCCSGHLQNLFSMIQKGASNNYFYGEKAENMVVWSSQGLEPGQSSSTNRFSWLGGGDKGCCGPTQPFDLVYDHTNGAYMGLTS